MIPLAKEDFRSWGPGPVAPVIKVDIEANGVIVASSVSAIIDSGADITCVNRRRCDMAQLGAKRLSNRNDRFLAAILINGQKVIPPYGIWNLQSDFFGEEVVVIGRDLLNRFKVTFDGCREPPRVTIWECGEIS